MSDESINSGENLSLVVLLITLIGVCKVIHFLLLFLAYLWKLTYAFILPNNLNFNRFGQWAVVTGCTEGIGKSYACLLAQRGIDLVLISRNANKLQTLAISLQQTYRVQTQVIVADFKHSNIYPRIETVLRGLDICVLVNNVGVSYYRPGRFLEVDPKIHSELLNINSLSCLMLTHLMLPGMLSKNKGVIINISSEVGSRPSPLLATYSATKSLMNSFTKALQYEHRRSDVIIQLVSPLSVQTRIDFQVPRFLAPLPDTFVHAALKSIGRLTDTCGCISHEIQNSAANLLLPQMFNIDMFILYRMIEKVKRLPDLRIP